MVRTEKWKQKTHHLKSYDEKYWNEIMPGISHITMSMNYSIDMKDKYAIILEENKHYPIKFQYMFVGSRSDYLNNRKIGSLVFHILKELPIDIKKIIFEFLDVEYIEYYNALCYDGFAKQLVSNINNNINNIKAYYKTQYIKYKYFIQRNAVVDTTMYYKYVYGWNMD